VVPRERGQEILEGRSPSLPLNAPFLTCQTEFGSPPAVTAQDLPAGAAPDHRAGQGPLLEARLLRGRRQQARAQAAPAQRRGRSCRRIGSGGALAVRRGRAARELRGPDAQPLRPAPAPRHTLHGRHEPVDAADEPHGFGLQPRLAQQRRCRALARAGRNAHDACTARARTCRVLRGADTAVRADRLRCRARTKLLRLQRLADAIAIVTATRNLPIPHFPRMHTSLPLCLPSF
jgi:hypothetical protein